jgi:hypothetical protein
MARRINSLYATAALAVAALTGGCSGLPTRDQDNLETRCENPNVVAGTLAGVVAEPFIFTDKVLQGAGDYLILGAKSNDLMTGGYLVPEGTPSVYDGHGESIFRGWTRWGKHNAAAALAIYGATNSSGSGSNNGGGQGQGPVEFDMPGGPGIQ